MKIGDNNPLSGLGNIFENEKPENTAQKTGFGGADALDRNSALNFFQQLAGMASSERVGTTSQALSGDPYPTLPNVTEESFPAFDQGTLNSCGTTSLAMLMTYLGCPQTMESIDAAIRRNDIFTAPNDLIEFARDNGLAAEGYNNGSINELKSFIENGYPVQCLINNEGGSDPSKLHYVDVIGFELDTSVNPPVEMVLLRDPNHGAPEPQPTKMTLSEFENKWDSPGPGFDHYFNAYGPAGAQLPPGRTDGIEGVLTAADGIANMSNGIDRIVNPDSFGGFVHGLFQVPGGFGQTLAGGLGALAQLGGNWLHDAVDGIPILENIVQPFSDIFITGGAVLADVGQMFGEALDGVGGAFESLFDGDIGGFFGGLGGVLFDDIGGGIFDIFGDIGGGAMTMLDDLFGTEIFGDFGGMVGDGIDWIGNAVSDLAGDAVDAAGDFFSDVGSAVADAGEAVGDAVGGFVEDVGDFFGF